MDVEASLCYLYAVFNNRKISSLQNKVDSLMTPLNLLSQQDGFNEECAVFGVYGSSEAHVLTALGLHALQHRGQ